MFAEFISNYGMQILGTAIVALAGYVGAAVKKLFTKYINDKIKRSLAKTVVQFVEQVYKDLHGEEKLNAAMAAFSEMLAEKGITVSELEMRVLLEAAVAEFNDAFNSEYIMVEGVAVEDLDDDQLRSVLQQIGYAYTEGMTREEMLAALDEETAE